MLIRYTIILLLTFISWVKLFSQLTNSVASNIPWEDTTLIAVKLKDTILSSKVVCVDIGKKATIFLGLSDVLEEVKKPENKDIRKIKRYLNSAKRVSDTIFISDLRFFDYIVSGQLLLGNAKVFYKKENIFIKTIYHRLENYGMYESRFFYLPNNRPFFSTLESIGISKNGKYFSAHAELGELFIKLSSLQDE